jgi:hypothetical protein
MAGLYLMLGGNESQLDAVGDAEVVKRSRSGDA